MNIYKQVLVDYQMFVNDVRLDVRPELDYNVVQETFNKGFRVMENYQNVVYTNLNMRELIKVCKHTHDRLLTDRIRFGASICLDFILFDDEFKKTEWWHPK